MTKFRFVEYKKSPLYTWLVGRVELLSLFFGQPSCILKALISLVACNMAYYVSVFKVGGRNEIQLFFVYNMASDLDTNWIQRRDDVLKLLSLLDFYFARAVQVPLSLLGILLKEVGYCKIIDFFYFIQKTMPIPVMPVKD